MDIRYNASLPESILAQAEKAVGLTLRDIIDDGLISGIEADISRHGTNRKGFFGDLVQEYVFGKKPDSRAEADFPEAGVELKTTPLLHKKGRYTAKERISFSMINYEEVVSEEWDSSAFLRKNAKLLLMFYLYAKEIGLLDYEIKFVHLLDMLKDMSENDVWQIRADWQKIVDKVKAGKAHELSEGDTMYLGAATKSSDSSSRRKQPFSDIPAKPRAFSLKQSYLNSLVQRLTSTAETGAEKLIKEAPAETTIEDFTKERFEPYIGLSEDEIAQKLGLRFAKKPKNFRRLLVNGMLGVKSNKIEEFEKADVTIRVLALEPSGKLKESVSFPAFDYIEIASQEWEDSDMYRLVSSRRFLFVVFRKRKNMEPILEKAVFWNMPDKDIEEVERVWTKTRDLIKSGNVKELPKISESYASHVRPHGKDSTDVIDTGFGTKEVKKCFWLNAKYVEGQIGGIK
jgi:DNA mismatch repair protein MutH